MTVRMFNFQRLSIVSSGRPVLTALVLASLAACSGHVDDSYFPLHPGGHWHYQLKTEVADPPVDAQLDLSVDRLVQMDGVDTWVRRSNSGVEYYLQQKKEGLSRIASRLDVEEQATLDPQPQIVLPEPLKVGAEWTAPTVPYILRRMAEFPRELKYRSHATMHYAVVALDETVEVPAGSFSHCVKVRGDASLRLYVDPAKGFADQPLITTEWYCKGVGLVRFDRDESVQSAFLSGGSVSYVLTDYSL